MNTSAPTNDQDEHTRHRVGAMRGEVWLILQTYQAQSLVRGRRRREDKPAIIGLLYFADRLKTLWQAARHDDPYADWWLFKIEQAIIQCRERLGRLFEQFSTVLASQDSLQLTLAESSNPQRIDLQFANPYAFRAAQMLAEFDRLMCVLMTARHIGLASTQTLDEHILVSSRWLRGVFALPLGYRCYDIDRVAVIRGSERALEARERMGELPDDVLRRKTMPSLRPPPERIFSTELPAMAGRDEGQANLDSAGDTKADIP